MPSSNDNVILNANATIPSGFVAQAGTIDMGTSGNLILSDGAQLIHGNDGVTATVKKEITGVGNSWSSASNGWYFIASPTMAENGINPTAVSNLVGSDYDLYRLSGTTWENAKAYENDFVLNNGAGYLYTNINTVTLEFTGKLKPYSETNQANQVNVENMDLDYLHLIDNMTGADVDLLSVPESVEGPNATGTGPSASSGSSYTFTAKTIDYTSRFRLAFSICGGRK